MTTWIQYAADLFGVNLSPEQVAAFDLYYGELAAWNSHTNLTAIIDQESVEIRHFLDSLSVVTVYPMQPGIKIIDVGTGAGFPGLPLAIVYPQVRVALLESTGKKTNFLDHVIREIGLTNAFTVNARAEEAGHDPKHRGKYDMVVARAVARMPALMEYLLPLAKVGGRCIAMKGATAEKEAEDSNHALQLLGGRLHRMEAVNLPEVEGKHFLVVVEKTDTTPKAYPRKPGIPTRKPL